MKLRNKKTGEIIEKYPNWFVINSGEQIKQYNSLTKLNEEWEDYEEQKEWYWFIEDNGIIQRSCHYEDLHPTLDKARKEIGNYFDTREEAEKAVEKLKAWKRLKDKGFKAFSSNICGDDFIVNFKLTNHVDYSQSIDDLDCILDFGGEEWVKTR